MEKYPGQQARIISIKKAFLEAEIKALPENVKSAVDSSTVVLIAKPKVEPK